MKIKIPFKKIINKLKKRVEELKVMRDRVTGNGSRNKYNFAIGELQGIIKDLNEKQK